MDIHPEIIDKNEKEETNLKSPINSVRITKEQINIISDSKFASRNINLPKIEYPGILEITVISSQSMRFGTKIKIDKMGLMEKSLRNIKSNIIYFGNIEDLNLNNNDNENSIDYLLPQKKFENEDNEDIKFSGRFFRIYFNTKNLHYYLRDLGNCLGTYVKIKEPTILKNDDMINIGDTYLIFKFETSLKKQNFENKVNNNDNSFKDLLINDIINIHVAELNHNKESQSRNFKFDSSKKIIRIGRKKNNNDIELKDSLVSKINCNIQYNGFNGWLINDGNEIINHIGEIKNTQSTNGTWILAIDDFRIYENMVFKCNFNIFKCHFIKQN